MLRLGTRHGRVVRVRRRPGGSLGGWGGDAVWVGSTTDCSSGLDLGVPVDPSSGQLPFVMVELDAYTPNTPQGADPPLVSIVAPLPMADDQRVISVQLPD